MGASALTHAYTNVTGFMNEIISQWLAQNRMVGCRFIHVYDRSEASTNPAQTCTVQSLTLALHTPFSPEIHLNGSDNMEIIRQSTKMLKTVRA